MRQGTSWISFPPKFRCWLQLLSFRWPFRRLPFIIHLLKQHCFPQDPTCRGFPVTVWQTFNGRKRRVMTTPFYPLFFPQQRILRRRLWAWTGSERPLRRFDFRSSPWVASPWTMQINVCRLALQVGRPFAASCIDGILANVSFPRRPLNPRGNLAAKSPVFSANSD